MSEERLEIAREIFYFQNELTKHEDEKARSYLVSLAFIMSAGAIIYNVYLSKDISYFFKGLDLIPIVFYLFLFFAIMSASFCLIAIGPYFYLTKAIKRKSNEDVSPKSILFWQEILKFDETAWRNFFNNAAPNIKKKIIENYIQEAYLIANKIRIKVSLITVGRYSYFIASINLIILTTLGIKEPFLLMLLILLVILVLFLEIMIKRK